jgi:hypothetical protein
MLINDSGTIATEIPVYPTNDDISYFKSYRTPITGYIGILLSPLYT